MQKIPRAVEVIKTRMPSQFEKIILNVRRIRIVKAVR